MSTVAVDGLRAAWVSEWVSQTLDAEEKWVACVRANHNHTRRCDECETHIAKRDELYLRLGEAAGMDPPPMLKEGAGQLLVIRSRSSGKTFMTGVLESLEDERERRLLPEAGPG